MTVQQIFRINMGNTESKLVLTLNIIFLEKEDLQYMCGL